MFSSFVNLVVLIGSCWAIKIPAAFPKCCIQDPNLSECILYTANQLQPYIKDGIREIGLPSLNPFVIPHFVAKQHTEGLNYTATLTNFKFYGMHNYRLQSIHYDPRTLKMSGHIEFSPTPVSSDLEIQGRILYMHVTGKGNFTGAYSNINVHFDISGEMITRGKTEYYKPRAVKVRLNISDMGINFAGLFDGNENLLRLANMVMNANSKQIIKLGFPVHEQAFEEALMRGVNYLTSEVPYNKIFPCI